MDTSQDDNVVLVVDDEKDLAEIVGKQLNLNQMKTHYVLNGNEAFLWLQERQQRLGESKVLCVISDWMMANGDGVELLQKVRGNPSFEDIPFILMSGAVTKEILLSVAKFGPDGILLKPFSVEVLMAEVKKAMESRQQKALKKALAKAGI